MEQDERFNMLAIEKFLGKHLHNCSELNFSILEIISQTDKTNDPGNEFFYLIHLDPHTYVLLDYDPIINIRKLNNLLQREDWTNGDHAVTVENPILMNTTIFLPFTFLK